MEEGLEGLEGAVGRSDEGYGEVGKVVCAGVRKVKTAVSKEVVVSGHWGCGGCWLR